MKYTIILLVSMFITSFSVAMDLEEKLRQDTREYWDKLKEEDKSDKDEPNDQDFKSRMQERNQENILIAMIAEHVAKL